jgi:acetyltransferase-like isoleucine patch superfamily enzyme
MIKRLFKKLLRRAYRAGQLPPTLLCPERIYGLDKVFSLHPTALVAVRPEAEHSGARVSLGADVYVGKDVEIAAIGPGSVVVGEDTSFQDRCLIYGDVEIGANCIFARNVLVVSTEHKMTYRPNWLIRDQDEQFHSDMAGKAALAGRKIHIEEDCWIGWGSAIMPGTYIGRGAVIGANSVVTRDVAPYEIHGGAPNRKLGERLIFSPPSRLDATNENCLPYFYRGFRQRQADLKRCRAQGVIEAGTRAVIVLAHGQGGAVRLSGINPGEIPLILTPSLNGAAGDPIAVAPGKFDVTFSIPTTGAPPDSAPNVLSNFTRLELGASPAYLPWYGLSSAELQT